MSASEAEGDPGAAARLRIDLAAIARNYARLRREAGGLAAGAAVKADAYGLGVARVAPALHAAGCRWFFVAQADEGVALRPLLPRDATIAVLSGAMEGDMAALRAHGLVPVLNDLGQVARWRDANRAGTALPAALHVDTGMARLGLPPAEVAVLADAPDRLDGVPLVLVMSHLACSDEPGHPMNAAQLARFRDTRARLPPAPSSLAASSGIFLGPPWHFDLLRPGAALYGVNPVPGRPSPVEPVVALAAPILQVRSIDARESVGYGAAFLAPAPARIATVSAGYADGLLRSLSNRTSVRIDRWTVPVVGRVSMDLITLDVTAVPDTVARPGVLVHLLDGARTVDDLARDAGTIGYEILTALGRRYRRHYAEAG